MIETWYYVYTLRYPDNTVFYVGKGKDKRINQHEKVALTLEEINLKSAKIIEAYLNEEKIIKQYEAYFRIQQHAYVYEAMLIEKYGLDNLTNRSKGIKERILETHDIAEIRLNNIEIENKIINDLPEIHTPIIKPRLITIRRFIAENGLHPPMILEVINKDSYKMTKGAFYDIMLTKKATQKSKEIIIEALEKIRKRRFLYVGIQIEYDIRVDKNNSRLEY